MKVKLNHGHTLIDLFWIRCEYECCTLEWAIIKGGKTNRKAKIFQHISMFSYMERLWRCPYCYFHDCFEFFEWKRIDVFRITLFSVLLWKWCWNRKRTRIGGILISTHMLCKCVFTTKSYDRLMGLL